MCVTGSHAMNQNASTRQWTKSENDRKETRLFPSFNIITEKKRIWPNSTLETPIRNELHPRKSEKKLDCAVYIHCVQLIWQTKNPIDWIHPSANFNE